MIKYIKNFSLFITAILIATFIRTFIVQIYYIPSASMEPTLNIDDRVIVLKDKFINVNYEIGDVIVFYNPNYAYKKNTFQEFYESLQVWNFNNEQLTIDTAFIKRVIGLEGDVIQINKNGEILNNGIILEIDNVIEENIYKDFVYIVEKNTIFVLGDNRKNSIDSRIYGAINKEQIIGIAAYKIYPFSEIQKIND
ncbi:MAG: signal peptidase I [Candidatus Actinomarinales bacterium]|nr:MAG: signal peptidase I [Candidatus Actinomarinales bacterium]